MDEEERNVFTQVVPNDSRRSFLAEFLENDLTKIDIFENCCAESSQLYDRVVTSPALSVTEKASLITTIAGNLLSNILRGMPQRLIPQLEEEIVDIFHNAKLQKEE